MAEKNQLDQRVRFEFPRYVSTFLQNQIRQSDAKAAGVFSVLGIATGILFGRITGLEWDVMVAPKTVAMVSIALILLVITFKEVIFVIYPRVQNSKGTSMIYFRDIARMDKDKYISAGLALDEEDILRNLYRHAHRYSGIVEKKFKALKIAMICGGIALLWIVITLAVI